MDPATGVASYKIISDSFGDAADVQTNVSDPFTVEEMNRRLEDSFPGVVITDNQVDPDVTADVDVVVDTEDSTKDADQAAEDFANSESGSGFDTVETESNLVTWSHQRLSFRNNNHSWRFRCCDHARFVYRYNFGR